MSYGRYEACPVGIRHRDGHKVQYLRRRFLPDARDINSRDGNIVQIEERLDQLSSRLLNDPLLFWKLADANQVLDPRALEEADTIKVPK